MTNYLSGGRIQGSSTGDAQAHGKMAGTSGTGSAFADFGRTGNNNSISYDLGSALGSSANEWILEFKFHVDTVSYNHGSGTKWGFGMSSLPATTGYGDNQDHITINLAFSNNGSEEDIQACNGNGQEIQSNVVEIGSNLLDPTTSAGRTWFVQIKRTSDTAGTIKMGTDSYGGTANGGSATLSNLTANVTGLQYFVAKNFESSSVNNHVYGNITDVKIYDNQSSATTVTYNIDAAMGSTTGWVITTSSIVNIIPTASTYTDEKATLVTGTALVGMGSAANGSISGATHSTTSPPVGVGWLDFDGSNDHFTADGTADACTTVGTVSVWFHEDDYSSGDGDRLFDMGDGSGEFLASINSTGKVAFIMQHGSTIQWNGSTDASSITNNTWYHVVITQNGTSPKFWLGALGSAITDQTNLSTTTDVTKWFESSWNSFDIGVNQSHSSPPSRLNGGIAEFACWNTVLTDSQISDLHNASGNGVSASTIPIGLRVLFNFDVSGETDNKALTGTTYTSNLPAGTRFEETDTRKIFRIKDGNWVERGTA